MSPYHCRKLAAHVRHIAEKMLGVVRLDYELTRVYVRPGLKGEDGKAAWANIKKTNHRHFALWYNPHTPKDECENAIAHEIAHLLIGHSAWHEEYVCDSIGALLVRVT